MGCCSGLFKSKKNKKKTKHNNNSQFAAPRPVQHVVQNGKVSYQPAGATSQYNGGGGGGYYQPAPYNTQPTGPGYRPTTAGSAGGGAYAYQQQGEYQHDPEYLAKLAVNQSIAGTVGSRQFVPAPVLLPPRPFGGKKRDCACGSFADRRVVQLQWPSREWAPTGKSTESILTRGRIWQRPKLRGSSLRSRRLRLSNRVSRRVLLLLICGW